MNWAYISSEAGVNATRDQDLFILKPFCSANPKSNLLDIHYIISVRIDLKLEIRVLFNSWSAGFTAKKLHSVIGRGEALR